MDCGQVNIKKNSKYTCACFPMLAQGKEYSVTKFSDITDIILPFFSKYTLHGSKRLDFADSLRVVELMQNKTHLTEEGLERIRTIKSGMNRGRSV